MRLLFLFLLIVNLLFGAWIYTQPEKQAAAIPPLPSGLDRVLLLQAKAPSEPLSSMQVDPSTSADPEPKAVPTDQQEGPFCYTLGPFNDESAIADIKQQLSEKLSDMHVRRREERERHRYWVYIPSLGSRAQAAEVSKALAGKHIKDYYIVRSGEDNNSISLGHFKEKKHADWRLKQLKKLGFDVQMEVIYRQYNLYWLDYRVDSPIPDEESPVAAYLGDGVSRLDRDCTRK